MTSTRSNKFLLLDDQLAPGHEPSMDRVRDALKLPDVNVIEAYSWVQVRQAIESREHHLCGFIVDLHLLTLERTDNFRALGLSTVPYDPYWAGGQFIKIMTHPDYANDRETWANGALKRYEESSFLILSSNQCPGDAITKFNLNPATPTLWKDEPDGIVEERLRDWTTEQLKKVASATNAGGA